MNLYIKSASANRIVITIAGIILLTAAALKLYGLSVSSVPAVGWFASPSVQFLTVVWELVLGVALVGRVNRPVVWCLAVLTFGLFTAVSGYLGYLGVTNCGCFGVIRATPWHAFAADLTVLAALVAVKPDLSWSRDGLRRETLGATRYAGGVAALLLLLLGVGYGMYGSLPAVLARLRGEALGAPQYLDFGSGPPGGVFEQQLPVTNYTDQPVRLIGGTSDCSCVTTTEMPITLAPGETLAITIRLKVPPAGTGRLTRTAEIWTDCDRQRTLKIRLGCLVTAGP